MALGRVIDVKWIHEGKVYIGDFCTAQGKSDYFPTNRAEKYQSILFLAGIVQQLGETGSALATLVRIMIYLC